MKKPFGALAIRDGIRCETVVFSIDENPGNGIDPCDDTLEWNEFVIFGVTDEENDLWIAAGNEVSFTTQIGSVLVCHIPKSLIINLGGDPYDVCDSADTDLEAMYSVLQEYEDSEEFEDFVFIDDIFYIHEIELNSEYQGLGYEETILQQLPAVIVKSLRVFPSLLMYYPTLVQHSEQEIDKEIQTVLRHRMEYAFKDFAKDKNSKVVSFPPKHKVSEKDFNRHMGRRNPGDITPAANRNPELIRLYHSVGFKELGHTGWLYKRIINIFTKDGLHPQ